MNEESQRDEVAPPMEKCEWADHPKDIERPIEKHLWYPKNSFERFAKPVCGNSCKVCKGFALEIEEDRERPCPVCYPGPADSSLDSENAPTTGSPVCLVYQWRDGTAEFQGVFTSEAKAINACRTENHCVCPATMDEELPQESGPWHGAWYPHLESRPSKR